MLYYIGLIFIPFLVLLCILGFIKRKSYDAAHSLIYISILFALISEVLMRIFAWYFKNNIVLYNLSGLIEFFIFFMFFYNYIGKSISRYIYLIFVSLFLIFYTIEITDKGLLLMFNYTFLYKNVLLLSLAIVALPKIVNSGETPIITDYSIFWINTAILVYYSCTLFIFGLRKYTVHLSTLTLVASYLHLFFAFTFYSLLSVGLWKTSRKLI